MCSQHKNDLEAHRDQTMQGQYSMARGLIFIQRTMARYCSIKTKEKNETKTKKSIVVVERRCGGDSGQGCDQVAQGT